MPPRGNCPNCGQNEWLENPELNYLPRVNPNDDGTYAVDMENGIHIKAWRCNNCMLIVPFWEPD